MMNLKAVEIRALSHGSYFVDEHSECISHSWGDAAWTLVEKEDVIKDIDSAIVYVSGSGKNIEVGKLRALKVAIQNQKAEFIAFEG